MADNQINIRKDLRDTFNLKSYKDCKNAIEKANIYAFQHYHLAELTHDELKIIFSWVLDRYKEELLRRLES